MKWSATSHSGAAVLGILVSAALVEYTRPYFPTVYASLEQIAFQLSRLIEQATGIAVNPVYFVPLFVLAILTFFWGWLFHRFRHGKIP